MISFLYEESSQAPRFADWLVKFCQIKLSDFNVFFLAIFVATVFQMKFNDFFYNIVLFCNIFKLLYNLFF